MFSLSVPFSGAWTSEGGRPPPSRAPGRRLLSSDYGLDQCSTSTWNPTNMITGHFELKRDQGAVEKVQSDMTYKGYENRRLVIEVCLTCWYRQFWIKAAPNTPPCLFYLGFQFTGLVFSSFLSWSRYLNMALLQGKRNQKNRILIYRIHKHACCEWIINACSQKNWIKCPLQVRVL